MIDPCLLGRTVLVTGANNPHGIGAAIAEAFASVGAKLFLHYYRDCTSEQIVGEGDTPGESFYRQQQRNSVDKVLTGLHRIGATAGGYEADFADPAILATLFDEAERFCGPVDVLVNNAAAWRSDTFIPAGEPTRNSFIESWTAKASAVTAEIFDREFLVNTRAPALLMKEFARRHVQRGSSWGRIINISTDAADCFPSETSYGASKQALESYTRSAAIELGQFGITVNVVSLGPVQTGWITQELERALVPTIPLGRIGHPSDVADVVLFLASEQARWITGQRIYVGGGHKM